MFIGERVRLLSFNPRGDVHSSHPPVQVAVPAITQNQQDKFWLVRCTVEKDSAEPASYV